MRVATVQQVFFLTFLNLLFTDFPKAEAGTWSLRAASPPVKGGSDNTLTKHSTGKLSCS